MEPLFRDGERILVDSKIPPLPDDYVAIWFKPRSRTQRAAGCVWWVKQLVAIEPGTIIVQCFNPPTRFALPACDVIALHRCAISSQCRMWPVFA